MQSSSETPPPSSQTPASEYDVVVIGGGFAGTFTVDQICRDGGFKNVLLIEAGNEILGVDSSSYNECYKLHTGLHYAMDKKTAVQCLENSVKFIKEFPDCIQGASDHTLPWRNGRHYLMSNSIINAGKVEKVCDALKKRYAKLIKKNPQNAVFGSPEKFIRYLDRQEYNYVADEIPCLTNEEASSHEMAHVVLGIETPESQIDLSALRNLLKNRLSSYSNLTTLFQHEVKRIQLIGDSLDYEIVVKDKEHNTTKTIRTHGIVNCTWQNIEQLDHQLGYYIPDGRIIRVKISLLVELPDEIKNLNTCIFFSGPYCSFTNLGNGEAIVTYEPITNVGYYSPLNNDVPSSKEKWWKIAHGRLTPDSGQGKKLARDILSGAAFFIPALKTAKVKEVRKGHVKIFSAPNKNYTIYKPDSPIHRRRENGIETKGLCYISHSGMKMTYTAITAKETVEILQRNFMLRRAILRLIDEVEDKLQDLLPEELYKKVPLKVILNHTFRHVFLEGISISFNTAGNLVDKKFIVKIAKFVAKSIQEKDKLCNAITQSSRCYRVGV